MTEKGDSPADVVWVDWPYMRQLLVLLAALLLLAPSQLPAQLFSAYGTVSATHAGNVFTGMNFTIADHAQYTSFWATGVGGGVTVNVLRLPVVSVGVDLRGSTKPGTNGLYTALAGVKFGLHAPGLSLKPYVQASGGLLGTRINDVSLIVNTAPSGFQSVTSYSDTASIHYIVYEALGGVDYPLNHAVDYRIVEVGGGSGHRTGGGGVENVTFFTIDTGIVAHF